MEAVTPPANPEGLGELLRQARVAKGVSQDSLARELRLPLRILNAIETEDWKSVPPGRERPLARLVARKVGVDLESCREAFEALPGKQEQEAPDPRRESMERVLMGIISVGSITLLAWLVVPGQGLKSKIQPTATSRVQNPAAPYVPETATGPYPVLGEVLPEAPINDQGIRISLRAMDTCEAEIKNDAGILKHSLRVSEPWSVRVKGPFTLTLDNAGVVEIEVAGKKIAQARNVGESWSGTFGIDGMLVMPPSPPTVPVPTAPETAPDPEADTDAELEPKESPQE